MVKLYHYTDTKGKTLIESSGYIRKSQQDGIRDDAFFGNGVYLTSISPSESTSKIVGNNWDGMIIPAHKKKQTEWYFVFDEDELDDVENVGFKSSTNRDIWLLRDLDLPIGGQKAKQRKV